jgi:hypothetical protein
MKASLLPWTLVYVSAMGCVGQLSTDEQDRLRREHDNLVNSTGTGGEAGIDPAECVIELASGPKCKTCHADTAKLAGFAFSPATIPNAKQLWLDKSGQGDPPGMMLACGAADQSNHKLIDSKAPEMSLIYAKLTDPVPCGMHMPLVGYPLPESEKACVLTWIKSVVGAPP